MCDAAQLRYVSFYQGDLTSLDQLFNRVKKTNPKSTVMVQTQEAFQLLIPSSFTVKCLPKTTGDTSKLTTPRAFGLFNPSTVRQEAKRITSMYRWSCRGFDFGCHQKGSDVGSRQRKCRQEACALNFLSEGVIVVCQWGRWSSLSPSFTFPVSISSFFFLLLHC